MTDLPESKLPRDPGYWKELARRIRADAAGPLAAYAAREKLEVAADPDVWYGVLARRASWLVAASAAAMLVLWLALPSRGPSVAFRWIERSLSPDDAAGSLVSGAEPPSVEVLMAQFAPESQAPDREERR